MPSCSFDSGCRAAAAGRSRAAEKVTFAQNTHLSQGSSTSARRTAEYLSCTYGVTRMIIARSRTRCGSAPTRDACLSNLMVSLDPQMVKYPLLASFRSGGRAAGPMNVSLGEHG